MEAPKLAIDADSGPVFGSADADTAVPAIPVWDARRPRRITGAEWDIFQRLDTPYRLERARQAGAGAYIAIAVSCAFSAAAAFFSGVKVDPLIGDSAAQVGRMNLLVGVLCVLLFMVTRKSRSYSLAYFALAWSLAEFAVGQTYALYGHGAVIAVAVIGLCLAIVGVRAAHAGRHAVGSAEPN
ncbi:hypothetical protein BH10PSE1_BH10PSE1_02240 [soil metagenome]